MVHPACKDFITKLPKAELHVHIEGTMEPSMLLAFAQRNNIEVPSGILDASGNYSFSGFDQFIDTYFLATQVLCTQQDFYELTLAYLKKVADQGVLRTEIFFELQSYMSRNIGPDIIIGGMHTAFVEGKRLYDIDGAMILCFLRHLSEKSAFEALELLKGYKDKVIGVGLAAYELNNPPSKFERVFTDARLKGYHVVAHAGELDSKLIRESIDLLGCERIDHGVTALADPSLVKLLAVRKIPLTLCPLSNVVLKIVNTIQDHPLKKLFDAGIMVTINSDDPSFFGGYIAENYLVAAIDLGFSCGDLVICARNSLVASFADEKIKKNYLEQLSKYVAAHCCK